MIQKFMYLKSLQESLIYYAFRGWEDVYTTPWASIASATLTKPPIFAPFT